MADLVASPRSSARGRRAPRPRAGRGARDPRRPVVRRPAQAVRGKRGQPGPGPQPRGCRQPGPRPHAPPVLHRLAHPGPPSRRRRAARRPLPRRAGSREPGSIDGAALRATLEGLVLRPFPVEPPLHSSVSWGGHWAQRELGMSRDARDTASGYDLIAPESETSSAPTAIARSRSRSSWPSRSTPTGCSARTSRRRSARRSRSGSTTSTPSTAATSRCTAPDDRLHASHVRLAGHAARELLRDGQRPGSRASSVSTRASTWTTSSSRPTRRRTGREVRDPALRAEPSGDAPAAVRGSRRTPRQRQGNVVLEVSATPTCTASGSATGSGATTRAASGRSTWTTRSPTSSATTSVRRSPAT